MKLLLFSLLTVPFVHAAFTTGDRNREVVMCVNSVHGGLDWYDSHSKAKMEKTCRENVARIQFVNSINETGWAMADITITDSSVPDYIQGYSAGFVEGAASRDIMDMHHYNLFHDYCVGAEAYCARLQTYLVDNLKFMRQYIAKYPDDPYWRQVNMTLAHMDGMIDGYEGTLFSHRSDEQTAAHKIYMIQLQAESYDLEVMFERPVALIKRRDHCSAIIKVTPGNANLLFAHNTWDSFASMLRVQRRISFALPDLPGRTYTMSSYPGTLSSIDDFLISSAKLAIMETTNAAFDLSIFKKASSRSVMTWIRSQVATRLANYGGEWVQIFTRYNSGTYNNQWMIVDYKLFTPGMAKLPKETFMILEQFPGAIEVADRTEHLQNERYWPSYNRPYFDKMFALGGYPYLVEVFGEYMSYNMTARAKIMRRDHSSVTDIDSLRKLMRYNNFLMDPLSQQPGCSPTGNAILSIAARSDLNPACNSCPIFDLNSADNVATDYKITDATLVKTLSFEAESGPTRQGVPVFDWSTSQLRDKIRHSGHPTRWEFAPVTHVWGVDNLF